jgi:dihydrofolate reductase
MRKIVFMMSVSLDGFFEGPDRELDWHMVDDEVHRHFNDVTKSMGTFMDGRITWENMAGFWPEADKDPGAPEPVKEFAEIWRNMPKYVFSRTLREAGWGTVIKREVDPAEIEAIKAEPGGDIGVGGAELAAVFMRLGLIDDYRIYVHPVAIGAGRPLFVGGVKLDLDLVETRTFGNGVVLLRYQPKQPK